MDKLKTQSERKVYIKKHKILTGTMESEIKRVHKSIKDNESEFLNKKEISDMLGRLKYENLLNANIEYAKQDE